MPEGERWASDFQGRASTLHKLLNQARALGFLGPGSVDAQLDHAGAFAQALEAAWKTAPRDASPSGPFPPRAAVDLGTGGGLPGLVLAVRWASSFVFVEAQARRAAFLRRAVGELGLGERVVVEAERAEILGRAASRRAAFDLVTARGFGRPAVVAECAAPFLEVGGMLVVSEPPEDAARDAARWPATGLAELGMGAPRRVGPDLAGTGARYRFVAVPQERRCPDRFPRRVGVPAKRPLF